MGSPTTTHRPRSACRESAPAASETKGRSKPARALAGACEQLDSPRLEWALLHKHTSSLASGCVHTLQLETLTRAGPHPPRLRGRGTRAHAQRSAAARSGRVQGRQSGTAARLGMRAGCAAAGLRLGHAPCEQGRPARGPCGIAGWCCRWAVRSLPPSPGGSCRRPSCVVWAGER